jgi:soluble lytic murein transglycosylase-like protein
VLGVIAVFALIASIALMSRADEHDTLIAEAARSAGVDAALVRAIVWHESGFNAAKCQDGAYGLMQIGRGTGIEWAAACGVETFMVTDLLDARTNLQAGTWYLARALQRWTSTDDPVVFALADYAAGPQAVAEWAGESKRAADLLPKLKGNPAGEFVEAVLARLRR